MFKILAPAGALCFIAILMLMHALRRDADWRSQGVSHYAVGSYAWLMATGFAVLGTALASRAFALTGVSRWSAAVTVATFLASFRLAPSYAGLIQRAAFVAIAAWLTEPLLASGF